MSGKPITTLWYNFSYLGLIQVANFVLSLLVIPYLISVIGAGGFGVIAVAQILMFYLSVLVDYGFNRSAIREVALYKEDGHRLSSVFPTVVTARLLLAFFGMLLLVLLVEVVPLFQEHREVYYFGFAFVLGQAMLMNWFFQGMEKMQFNAWSSLFSRTLFVILVFIFIRHKNDLHLYLFFMGVGNMASGLLSTLFIWLSYKVKFEMPSRQKLKEEFRSGWHFTVSNLSMTTIQYGGLFILRLFTNDIVVGYYSIAEKIFFAMKLMLDVFSQSAYPRVCILMKEGIGKVRNFFNRSYLAFLLMVFTVSLVIFIMSPQLIRLFTREPSGETATLLRGLCIAVVIVCLNIPAALTLLAGDHKKDYLRVFSVGLLFSLVAHALLARYFLAEGTVAATILTEIFITAGLYLSVYRHYRAT